MFDVIFYDVHILIYCLKPRPSSLLRARFKMERLGKLSIDGLIHAINLGIDIYHPGSGGDAIIQTSPEGVRYLWKLLASAFVVLVSVAASVATIYSALK